MAEARMPQFVRDVVQFNLSCAKRPQPELALAGAIALAAVIIGRKVRDEFGTRPNVQIIAVAESGAGKDHARQINDRILSETKCSHLLGPEEVASDAGLFTMLQNSPSVLWQADEFGRFLKTTNSVKNASHLFAVPSALMRLFTSAGKDSFRPKAYGDPRKNLTINQPHLVLFATTTPETLFSALSQEACTF